MFNDTPETDAAVTTSPGRSEHWEWVAAHLARRLERERDEARQQFCDMQGREAQLRVAWMDALESLHPDGMPADWAKFWAACGRARTVIANAHALAEERSDDSQQRVVGRSGLKGDRHG